MRHIRKKIVTQNLINTEMENPPLPLPGNKLIPFLTVLLVVAAFLIGSMYTKIQMLEKGVGSANSGTNAAANAAAGQVAGAQQGNQPAPAAPANVDVNVANAPVLGNANAKVALVEFTDFQCPFCSQLFSNTFPQVKKEYIDTGKIKYMVRDFPLVQIHPFAQKAAEAASCANEQGKYWEMHDTLFKNQTALTIDDLKKYAADLGLNTSNFNSCLDSAKFSDKVKADTQEGEKYGVRGTPASFVGKVEGNTVKQASIISGAVPFDSFKTAIDEALKKS